MAQFPYFDAIDMLSNIDILREMKAGHIKISPFNPDQLGGASVDLTLSGEFSIMKKQPRAIDLSQHTFSGLFSKKTCPPLTLKPLELVLGKTMEKISLANNIAGRLDGRSRYARLGLAVHVTSSLIQPGSSNHQVLEIINFSGRPIKLSAGLRISQATFSYLNSPTTKPYNKFGKIAKNQ